MISESPKNIERFRLSPYCVFYLDPDGSHVTLIHALYGSKFQISTELFEILATFLSARELGRPGAALPIASAIGDLIEEKVLISEREFLDLGGENLFRNRLNSLEFAFHREFNEGGYFPESVDPARAPSAMKQTKGLKNFELQRHSDLPHCDLVSCLKARRSVRNYSQRPLKKSDFEKFLQLAAKADALVQTPNLGTTSLRNYPSGGARYPLEIYAVVENVQSLNKGIYYYHPFKHHLELVNRDRRYRTALLNFAVQRMGTDIAQDGRPAVLFLVTAVFGRTAWKYKGILLHLILQEVGALYQTMYLAATALKLAACAVGAFPEQAVAEILNLDSRDESQIGMFALGVADESRTLTIEELEVHHGSPFSMETDARSVNLTFSDGRREIIDLADFHLERSRDGRLVSRILRGTRPAELSEKAERKLMRMLRAKRRDPDLAARFGDLAGPGSLKQRKTNDVVHRKHAKDADQRSDGQES